MEGFCFIFSICVCDQLVLMFIKKANSTVENLTRHNPRLQNTLFVYNKILNEQKYNFHRYDNLNIKIIIKVFLLGIFFFQQPQQRTP